MVDLISIDGTEKPKEIDETLVHMLESMVQEAKEGRISSLAGVYIDDAGTNIEFTSIEPSEDYTMFGMLQHFCTTYQNEHLIEWEYDED